jgi:hypothetical protein
LSKAKVSKTGTKRTKLTEERLLKVADEYFSGKSYKQIKKEGHTQYEITKAINLADKKYHMDGEHLNLRRLVQLAHRQKGIVTADQVKRYSDFKELTYDTYLIRAMTLDDLEELYGEDYVEEKLKDNSYTPVVLEGVLF